MKRNLSMLAGAAVFLSSTALAGHGLELTPNSEIFQYGDSLYTWDLESGGAVRVGAIWDGFSSAKEGDTLFHQGDFVYKRSAMTGETVKVEAVWDGRVAAIEPATTLALKR
jgi:hypothetical protein